MSILENISVTISSLSTCIEIFRNLKPSISKEDSATAILDVRECLQTAREELLTIRDQASLLQEEKNDLMKQLADKTNFEDERDKFVTVKLNTGSVVCVENKYGERPTDAKFLFCTHCFGERKKSILQIDLDRNQYNLYKCNACDCTVRIPHDHKN